MKTIRVIRAFVLTTRTATGSAETQFRPGVQEVSDVVAEHPYIRDHLADGCIAAPGTPVPEPSAPTREPSPHWITTLQRELGQPPKPPR